MSKTSPNRYEQIIAHIFQNHYKAGATNFDFERTEINTAAAALGIDPVDNLGDLLYSFRYRSALPEDILKTAPKGFEWIIRAAGRSKYRFALSKINRIVPSQNHFQTKILDATPQIVVKYASADEQALLAQVRYNKLIDIFLRVTAYHLQSHLRTTVPEMGQIETDDVYVAVRNTGQQFVIPVQGKGGSDQIGVVQVEQDLALCKHAFPDLTARPVAVQFKSDEKGPVIVMFELVLVGGEVKVVDEKHYRLVPASDISKADLDQMASLSN